MINSDNDTVMIVDEADVNFIDQAELPPKRCRALICLTATVPKEEHGFVTTRLNDLGFDVSS